jgi:hypothetical protein
MKCDDDLLPSKGGTCARCGKSISPVPGATPADDEQMRALVRNGQPVSAIEFLREKTGCGLAVAKEMVDHMYGAVVRPLGPPCRSCGAPLRTPRAKFCVQCGARAIG